MQYLENNKSNKHLYNFRPNHSSGIIYCRLDYIFKSNKFRKFSNGADIIPVFKTDHSSVLVTVSNHSFLNEDQALGNLIIHYSMMKHLEIPLKTLFKIQ